MCQLLVVTAVVENRVKQRAEGGGGRIKHWQDSMQMKAYSLCIEVVDRCVASFRWAYGWMMLLPYPKIFYRFDTRKSRHSYTPRLSGIRTRLPGTD